MFFHLQDRPLDEARQIADHLELDVGGQRPLNLLELRLDPIDDRNGVGAGLLLDQKRDSASAIQTGEGPRLLFPVHRGTDVFDPDGRPLEVRDDQVIEVGRPLDPAERPQPLLSGLPGDVAARDLNVLALNRLLDLLDRKIVGLETVGIYEQLNLPLPVADEADRPDVLYSL